MNNSKKVVYEFMKNAGEKVIFELDKYKNNYVIGIRVYYNTSISKEDWRPCPKGITINVDNLPELKKGIDLAYKMWKQDFEGQK